jgi:hypothetical protein
MDRDTGNRFTRSVLALVIVTYISLFSGNPHYIWLSIYPVVDSSPRLIVCILFMFSAMNFASVKQLNRSGCWCMLICDLSILLGK